MERCLYVRCLRSHQFIKCGHAMTTVTDPVCGMEVDTDAAEWRSVYRGREYYFCAPGCKTAFDEDPARFID